MKSGRRLRKKTLSEQQLLQRRRNKLAAIWHHLVPETRMTNAIRQDLSQPLKDPGEETHKTNRNSSSGCDSLLGSENFMF